MRLLTSRNIANKWEYFELPNNDNLRGCIYGGGYYVIVYYANKFVYSNDLANWTTKTNTITIPDQGATPSQLFLRDITYTNGKFVIVGTRANEGRYAITSDITGSISVAARDEHINGFNKVCSNADGVVYAIDDHNICWLIDITDGTHTKITDEIFLSNRVRALGAAFGDSNCVAVGGYGEIATIKPDYTVINNAIGDSGYSWADVAYGNNKFVAIGNADSKYYVTISEDDGVTWCDPIQLDVEVNGSLLKIIYQNGVFVILTQQKIIFMKDPNSLYSHKINASFGELITTNGKQTVSFAKNYGYKQNRG